MKWDNKLLLRLHVVNVCYLVVAMIKVQTDVVTDNSRS